MCIFFFLKSLLNLLQYCFCFMFWVFWLQGMWDLSSLIRDQTCTPCIERWSLNHWTTREVLRLFSSYWSVQFLLLNCLLLLSVLSVLLHVFQGFVVTCAYICNVYIFLIQWFFYHYKMSVFISSNISCLHVSFVWY